MSVVVRASTFGTRCGGVGGKCARNVVAPLRTPVAAAMVAMSGPCGSWSVSTRHCAGKGRG